MLGGRGGQVGFNRGVESRSGVTAVKLIISKEARKKPIICSEKER